MADVSRDRPQRKQRRVLVHEVFLASNRLVVLEIHQIRTLLPDSKSWRTKGQYTLDFLTEPGLINLGKQFKKSFVMGIARDNPGSVLHERIPDLNLIIPIKDNNA